MSLLVIAPLARLVADIVDLVSEGKPPTPACVARSLMDVGVALVPVEDLRAFLEDAARRHEDARHEREKDERFGSGP